MRILNNKSKFQKKTNKSRHNIFQARKLTKNHKSFFGLRIKSQKGQAALEFLASYSWAFIILLLMVGVMQYFEMFNFSKYESQICKIDNNFYCNDFSIEQSNNSGNYSLNLLLQNNMNKEVEIYNITLYEDTGEEIVCENTKIYCPFKDNETYAIASPSNGKLILGGSTSWVPTRVCRISIDECPGIAIKGYKKKVLVDINFKGEDNTYVHTAKGNIYATVNEYSNESTLTGLCDLANFNTNSKFIIQDNTNKSLFMIDSNGMLLILGSVFENFGGNLADANDFKINNSDGNIVAWVSNPQGNLYLNGTLEQFSTMQSEDGRSELIFQSSSGGDVAIFDDSGNLYIRGCVLNIN